MFALASGLAILAVATTHAGAQGMPCSEVFTQLPATIPQSVGEASVAAIGGKIYVAGKGTRDLFAYNTQTETWKTLAERSFPGDHHAVEVVNGKLYLIGGFRGNSGNKVQIYDPASNTWAAGANIPIDAGSMQSGTLNGKILACGGIVNGAGADPTAPDCQIYDTASDTWTTAAPLPQAVDHAASCDLGGKTYVLGGRNGPHVARDAFNYVQVYDWATNSWTSSENGDIAAMPEDRSSFGCVTHNGAIYAVGSEYTQADAESNPNALITSKLTNAGVLRFTPGQGWTKVGALPTGMHATMPVVVNDKMFVIAGDTKAGGGTSQTSLSADIADFSACGAGVNVGPAPLPMTPPPPPMPTPPAAVDGWCIIVGGDFDGSGSMPGYDLGLPGQFAFSAAGCLSICESAADCDAVTFVAGNSRCYLKRFPEEGVRPVDGGFGSDRVLSIIGSACPCDLPANVQVLANTSEPCVPPVMPTESMPTDPLTPPTEPATSPDPANEPTTDPAASPDATTAPTTEPATSPTPTTDTASPPEPTEEPSTSLTPAVSPSPSPGPSPVASPSPSLNAGQTDGDAVDGDDTPDAGQTDSDAVDSNAIDDTDDGASSDGAAAPAGEADQNTEESQEMGDPSLVAESTEAGANNGSGRLAASAVMIVLLAAPAALMFLM